MHSIELIKGLLEKRFSHKIELNPMKGGINNEVFLCNTKNSFRKMFVVKIFSEEKSKVKERMKAETIFLNYVCDKLGASVPRIIDVFEKYNVLLLEYVEGKKFSNDCPISHGDFRKAVDFYNAINDNSESYRHNFKMAIEGYSDVFQHIVNIDERLSACELSHLPKTFQLEYSKVLQNVKLEWDSLKHRIQGSIESGRIENPLRTS